MPILDDGYELLEEFLSCDQLDAINNDIKDIRSATRTGGIRNVEKRYSSIRELSASEHLINKASSYLSGSASLVRAILFNKTPENNWLVSWHQDRTVAVSKKFEHPEWGPWSVKDNVHHVQPPVNVLNEMVTFRIHLDNTNLDNGCLKILPRSHEFGILDHSSIHEYVKNHEELVCTARAGSALVMRPHILHSSSKTTMTSQRRVLHLEYSSFELPAGITWA